jgi:hypothetical protein
MLSFTVLLAFISAVSAAKIFEEDHHTPAINAEMINKINVSKILKSLNRKIL